MSHVIFGAENGFMLCLSDYILAGTVRGNACELYTFSCQFDVMRRDLFLIYIRTNVAWNSEHLIAHC